MARKLIVLITLFSFLLVGAFSSSAGTVLLYPDEDEPERDYWHYWEVQDKEALAALQKVAAADAVPIAVELEKPINIAVLYPSLDVSDFWLRAWIATRERLKELEVPFNYVEFANKMNQHELQADYTDIILEEDFDYVIFGPTEYWIQKSNIQRLLRKKGTEVLIWNHGEVFKDSGNERGDHPLSHFVFDHFYGSQLIARYCVDRLGQGVKYALIRGTPGAIDAGRTGGFHAYVQKYGNWEFLYEHYAHFMREGGYEGGEHILTAFPEVEMIHCANTASAMGVVSAALAAGKIDEVFITGWGGTGDELDAIKTGELNATPTRMNDDLGVATAEAIKYHLEGRIDEVPLVYTSTITVAHDQMSDEEIDALRAWAFRYSGVAPLVR